MLKIAAQEQLLPGESLQEKWEFAQGAGYGAIELRAKGDLHFASRLPELKQALKDGVVMPTVCVDMLHFFGAFDDGLRRDAIVQMKSQLSVIAEIGGLGAQTPASYGMFSQPAAPVRAAAFGGAGPRDPARRAHRAGRARLRRGRHALPRTAQPVRGPHGQPP